ncbi:uncharacterized protein LOC126660597 [Mercurialis annua]|uniref:uncharacterized protein LOC126660597 n=1 Tax=Mercurialis annua TaxID=3986 RepID=UPI0024AEFF7F|nr:uncharacterized protein LOC126660597 [Mercurialis annua]
MAPPKRKTPKKNKEKDAATQKRLKVIVTWQKYLKSKIRKQSETGLVLEGNYNKKFENEDDRKEFSPQILVNNFGFLTPDLSLKDFKPVTEWLKDVGICTELGCPYKGTLPDNYKTFKPQPPFFTIESADYEEGIISDDYIATLLEEGPVLGVIGVYTSFTCLKAGVRNLEGADCGM